MKKNSIQGLSQLLFIFSVSYGIRVFNGQSSTSFVPQNNEELEEYTPKLFLYVGGDSFSKEPPQRKPFYIALNSKQLIIGDKSVGYGVDCVGKKGCIIRSISDIGCNFRGLKGRCKTISVNLQFPLPNSQDIPLPESTDKFQVSGEILENGKDVWKLNMNLLGIRPSSFFWDYLESAYQFENSDSTKKGYSEISLVYSPVRTEGSNYFDIKWIYEKEFSESYITLNGKKNEGQAKSIENSTTSSHYWTIDDVYLSNHDLSDQTNQYNKVEICISNTVPYLLGLKNIMKLKEKLSLELCGKKTNCRWYNSWIGESSPLVFKKRGSDEVMFKLDPVEYLQVEGKNRILTHMVDMKYFKDDCPSTANIALGLEFFSSHEISLRKYHGESRTEILFTRLNLPSEPYFRKTIWEVTDYIIAALHGLTWITFLVYIFYVMILRKQAGFQSRKVKDTTMYRPYSFAYDGEDWGQDVIEESEEDKKKGE